MTKGTTHLKSPFYTKGGSFYTNSVTRLFSHDSAFKKEQFYNISQKPVYESIALIPVSSGKRILGLIHLGDSQENKITLEMVMFLEKATMELGTAIQRIQAEDEQQKLQTQLIQSQKMESIGRLAGGIAHDFNNMLTVINGYSELGLDKVEKNDPIKEYLENIYNAGDRARELVRQLLAFSRKQIIKPVILDLNVALDNMQKILRRVIGENIKINIISDNRLWKIEADPSQIEQVIVNLTINASDAMPKGGKLTIETENKVITPKEVKAHQYLKPGEYVLLSISDIGEGMTDGIREHIFEPFFSTKKQGKGTGLGLSTVYGIIKQNKGFIDVFSEPGRGTTFKIYFPNSKMTAKNIETVRKPKIVGGTETILVVEDERDVRRLAVDSLSKLGYTLFEAEDGKTALDICNEHKEKIDLLLTDMIMPGMSGNKLSAMIKELYPGIMVLFMSGYSENAVDNNGVLKKELNFLPKPLTPRLLAQAVRKVLD